MSTEPVPRPGGRTAETTSRIFDAVICLLVTAGYAQCTFQAVADKAAVGRATLYRRWESQAALVSDALASRLETEISIKNSGAIETDLFALLTETARFLQSPLGAAALAAAVDLAPGEHNNRKTFWLSRHAAVLPLVDGAIARGELAENTDSEAFLASMVGGLYFRLLVMGMPADRRWIKRLLAEWKRNRHASENFAV